jgi:hypothetical protein
MRPRGRDPPSRGRVGPSLTRRPAHWLGTSQCRERHALLCRPPALRTGRRRHRAREESRAARVAGAHTSRLDCGPVPACRRRTTRGRAAHSRLGAPSCPACGRCHVRRREGRVRTGRGLGARRPPRRVCGSRPPSSEDRGRWLEAARKQVERRTAAVLQAQHRGAYERVARLVAACSEAIGYVEGVGRSEDFLGAVRERYSRYSAFKRELERALRTPSGVSTESVGRFT